MKRRQLFIVLVALFCTAPTLLAADKPGVRADEAPVARAYFNWVVSAIDKADAEMPEITKAAELAAEPFVAGKRFSVIGAVGLNEEMCARSGGFVIYRCEGPQPGGAVLYAFGVARATDTDIKKLLDKELTEAEKLRGQGCPVIGLASVEQLKAEGMLERAQKVCNVLLDNHAPAENGLFKDKSGKAFIPTFTTADPIVSWAWAAELFAACTRKGKTPAMYKSVMIDANMARYKKYEGVQFHDDIHVEPQPAGKLGHAFLESIRDTMTNIGTTSWKNLAETTDRAGGTIMDGGKVYLSTFGHYPPYHQPGVLAHDPAIFVNLNSNTKFVAEPTAADYAIGIGYMNTPLEKFNKAFMWGEPDKMRHAGRGISWVVSAYNYKPEDTLRNELVVDQQWAEGDAAVSVPGYDIKIIPPSGVVAEAMMWMITAQVWSDVEAHNAAKVKH